MLQDSSKVEEILKESEQSTIMISKLEEEIPKLQQLIMDEEKILEEIKESSKGGNQWIFLLCYRLIAQWLLQPDFLVTCCYLIILLSLHFQFLIIIPIYYGKAIKIIIKLISRFTYT